MTSTKNSSNQIFSAVERSAQNIDTLKFATSTQFRRSLFDAIVQSKETGPVIEIGCYTGGTSIFLAKACEISNRRLIIIDISEEFLNITKQNVNFLVPGVSALYFSGTAFDFFSSEGAVNESPFLIFIDADHRYQAVRQDIQAAKMCEFPTKFWAFHDYSLRGTAPNRIEIAVDRAIHDEFGEIDPIERIGQQIGKSPEKNVGGDYLEENGTEGVLFNSKAIKGGTTSGANPVQVFTSAIKSDLESKKWEDFLNTDPSDFDFLLEGYFKDFIIDNPRLKNFLNRWFTDGIPSIRKLNHLFSDEKLRNLYFSNFNSYFQTLEVDEQKEIFSTRQTYSTYSILNNDILNAVGLTAFRSCYIDQKIRDNRKTFFSDILESGLSPKTESGLGNFLDNFQKFERDGFVSLRIEPKTSLHALCSELSDGRIMQEKYLAKVDGDTLLYRKGLNSKETPEAISILNSSDFLPLFSFICGHEIKPIPAYAEFVHQCGGIAEDIDANKIWHMDTFHPTFKWWSFFRGVEKEVGPFMYYPGSHALTSKKLIWLSLYGLYKSINVKTGDISISPRVERADIDFLTTDQPVAFDVPEFTLVIADTHGIHRRSEPSEPGLIRRSLFGWARHELV